MKYKITLNGRTYEVVVEQGEAIVENEYDYVPPAAPAAPAVASTTPAPAPAAAPAAVAGEQVASPMPGSIVKVNVKAGQAVKSGEVLLVLEAMKMENEIMAPHDATVAQVLVDVGSKVDTGAPLVVLG